MAVADPIEYTGHLLRRGLQVQRAAWARHVSAEVTNVQFAVLSTLDRHPGICQADLGSRLDFDRATIAQLTRRLVERGLVHRYIDPTDRRLKRLELTELGLTTVTELAPLARDLESIVFDGLSDEQRAELRATLIHVLRNGAELGLSHGLAPEEPA